MRAGGDRRLGVEASRYAARSATGVVFIFDMVVGRGALRHVLLPAWVGAISLVYAAYEIARSLTLASDWRSAARSRRGRYRRPRREL